MPRDITAMYKSKLCKAEAAEKNIEDVSSRELIPLQFFILYLLMYNSKNIVWW